MNNLFGHTDAPDRAAPPRAASAPPRSTPPTPNATHFVRVAVERGIDVRSSPKPASPSASSPNASSIESGYTYSADAHLQVGERVHVPLGKGNKRAAGVVIDSGGPELALGVDPRRIKPILARTGVVLPPALVDLARWMSTYYVCPLGMVMSTMMPAAVKKGVGVRLKPRVELIPAPERPALETLALSKAALAAWDACNLPDTAALLAPDVANLSLKDLAARLSLKSIAPLNKLVKAGLLRITMKRTIVTRGWDAAAATTASLSPTSADIATTDPSAETPAALAPSPTPTPTPAPRRPELNPDQHHAVHGITASLNTFAVHLLFGVTGSGKTEVYLRVIEDALANDPTASAIVLVPEIALTPQTAERFVARFQHLGVAVLHSGLSSSQRAAQWALAASGAARVIVGARSAIFAPVPNLRVVIVDEEHDSSYKQDQLPRYHARDVAIKRIHAQAAATPGRGAVVVLGSATPSLESWRNATTGKYTLWRLPHRATGASMPAVQIIDMAKEWLDQRKLEGTPHALPYTWRGPHSIGPTLERSIRDTLRGDGQVMLLLNRRGFANVLVCPSDHCGWRLQCDACDALLVLHKRPSTPSSSSSPHAPSLAHSSHDPLAPTAGYVRCHHCLAENQTPRTCPACARPLIMLGAGTQRVEDEIIAKFGSFLKGPRPSPNTPVEAASTRRNAAHANTNAEPDLAARFPGFLRLDSDTMTSARDYFDSLGRFARGEARLLLGTQMIAKGLDFPNVHLVGVLSADTALNLPDFRAAERTYQLVSQVAGRAGRGVTPGRVIVQTYAPDSPPIIFAAKHDFEAFALDELQARQHAGLPPIARMARIVIRDERLEHAESAATRLVELLNAAQSQASARTPSAPNTSSTSPTSPTAPTAPDPRDAVRITGPFPCAIARIAGHHRFEILLLARSRAAIQSLLADLRSRGELVSDEHMAVDIDPVTLL